MTRSSSRWCEETCCLLLCVTCVYALVVHTSKSSATKDAPPRQPRQGSVNEVNLPPPEESHMVEDPIFEVDLPQPDCYTPGGEHKLVMANTETKSAGSSGNLGKFSSNKTSNGRQGADSSSAPEGAHPEPPGHVIPPKEVLEQMSHEDLQSFYHSYVNSPQETCSWVERMGLVTDGGWEHCDDPRWSCDPDSCLVYSYGISNDFSYDDDMAEFGCEVHSFDPSMNTKSHLRGERVHFHDVGVAGRDQICRHMGRGRDQTWNLYSIQTQRRLLNHTSSQRRVDVVKMDVEGYELESLTAALKDGALDDVRQLNLESHVAWHDSDPTRREYLEFLELFRLIYDKGFRIYLTHRNYMHSAFWSALFPGKKRVKCHEIHTVNIKHINADWRAKLLDRNHRMQKRK